MAAISIFDVQPHQVSKNLASYSYLIYGDAKVGKTTLASKFPKPLLLAFERGYNALPGVMALPVNTWGEAKKYLRELKQAKAHEMYSTVIIDTADIAYSLCEKYIIDNYVPKSASDAPPETISDIPFGGGYKLVEKEFDDYIRSIINNDYCLVLISHAKDKVCKDDKGKEYNQINSTLESKGKLVCERACDLICYARSIGEHNNEKNVKLFLRGCDRYNAGGRFKYIEPIIDMDYNALMQAISDAIDAEAAENNNTLVTENKDTSKITVSKNYDFDALMQEAQKLCVEISANDPSKTLAIKEIISDFLGTDKKLSDCTEKQAEIIYHIIEEIKKLV